MGAPTIVVIGGGFTGLATAHILGMDFKWYDVRIVLLEASERTGGSVRSGYFERYGVPYDAGAAEIYDIAGAGLSVLIRSLGLSMSRLSATPWFFMTDGTVLRSENDFKRYLGTDGVRCLTRFWRRGLELRPFSGFAGSGGVSDNRHPWSRKTFAQVLKDEIPNDKARTLTAIQSHSDIAAEPNDTNGVFAFDNLLIDHPGYCWLKAIDGGNERLVKTLAEKVDAAGGGPGSRIWKSCRVSSVTCLQNGAFLIDFDRRGVRESITADFVVVAATPYDVKKIEFRPPAAAEAVRRHLEHHDMSTHYLRVTFLTKDRCWKAIAPEDYFVTDAFEGVTVYDQTRLVPDGKPYGIMSWLLSGKPAAEISKLPDAEICRRIMAAMPPPLVKAVGQPLECKVDRFMNAVSRQPGGLPILPDNDKHTPCRAFRNLIFTGDYLYDSTLHGCLESATTAADQIGAALGIRATAGTGGSFIDPEAMREIKQANDRMIANSRPLPFLKGGSA